MRVLEEGLFHVIGPNLSGAGLTKARTGSSRAQGDMHRLWEGLYQYMPYTEESRCKGKSAGGGKGVVMLHSAMCHNSPNKHTA